MRKRFMQSEIAPKSIRDVFKKFNNPKVVADIAAAMEIEVSGTPQKVQEQVIAALNSDAEALAVLLLKIDREIFDFTREIVEKGKASMDIMELLAHSVSADRVSFFAAFFPENKDEEKVESKVQYFMPTDKGFGDNIRRLFADDDFQLRRERVDGLRGFLRGVALFYGIVSRSDLNKVIKAIGGKAVDLFKINDLHFASVCFDFVQNGIVGNSFELCILLDPTTQEEYIVPFSAPKDKDEEKYFNALFSRVLERRRGKLIKLPTLDDISQLTQGREYDFIQTAEGEDWLDFLMEECDYDEEDGTEMLGYVAINVRMGVDADAIIKKLFNEFGLEIPSSRKQAEKFFTLFANYYNSVPTWENYGASPAEMREQFGMSDEIDVRMVKLPRKSQEDVSDERSEELVPSVYPNGPVDFAWVKDLDEKKRRLEEYDCWCRGMSPFTNNYIPEEINPKEYQHAEKALGIEGGAKNDMQGVCLDFAANIQLLRGTNARLRLIARKDEMDLTSRVVLDYYANYSYTWLKIIAIKSGVGMKCVNLLSGEELFLMEKSLSQNPQVKGMTLCVGIAPMNGDHYVEMGHAMLANFELPERFLADTLKNIRIKKQPPCVLTPKEQEKLAVATIRHIAANPSRICIY